MDQKSRRVYLNLFSIETMPVAAREYVGCSELVKLMKRLETRIATQGLAHHTSSTTGRVTRLRAMRVKPRGLALLISHSDPTGGDPVFEHLQTGAQRVEPKADEEGLGSSVHVVIYPLPVEVSAHSKTYISVLEWGPYLGRSNIALFLNRQLKAAAKKYKDERGNERTFYHKIDIKPLASESFLDALSEGRPLGFKVQERIAKSDKFDESARIEMRGREILWKAGRGVNVEQFIKEVRKRCKHEKTNGYNTVVIDYLDAETNSARHKEFAISDDFINGVCTKSVRLDLDISLNQAAPSIQMELYRKMLDIAKDEYKRQKGDG